MIIIIKRNNVKLVKLFKVTVIMIEHFLHLVHVLLCSAAK